MDERIIIKKWQGQKYKGEITWKYKLKCLNCNKNFDISGAVFNRGEGQTCGTKCRGLRHGKVYKERGIIPWSKGKTAKDFPQLTGYWKGKILSENHCNKLSKSHKHQNNRLGSKHTEETRKKLKEWALKHPNQYWLGKNRFDISGKNNHFWRGGIDKNNYPVEFSEALKNRIRKRDNLICQLCRKEQKDEFINNRNAKLSIHHIDYNKDNCDEKNLISLCNLCHSKTGFDRDNWQKLFQNKISKIYS